MGNNAFNPLDLAAQLQLPVPGTTPAPEGDSAGANPFEFAVHPPMSGGDEPVVHPPLAPMVATPQDTVPPVPAPAPASVAQDTTQTTDPLVKPVDPAAAMPWVQPPAQGTTPAPAPAASSGWEGPPVVPPVQVPSGGEFVVHPPHIPLLAKPDPADVQKSWADIAKDAYEGTKKAAVDLVEQAAQGATAIGQEYMYQTGQMYVPPGETEWSRSWDGKLRTPEQIDQAQSGLGLIATTLLPEFKGAKLLETGVPPSIKAKALAWLSNHIANGAAAGLAYGTVASKSLDPMEIAKSATENALQFAWQAPALGAVFKGLGVSLGAGLKYSGLGPATEAALSRIGRDGKFVLQSATDKISNLIDQIKEEGGDPRMLPADVKDQVVAQAVHGAADEAQGVDMLPKRKTPVAVSPARGLTPPTKFTGAPKGGVLPEMTPPTEFTGEPKGGTLPEMTPPHDVTNLPDPGHEHQERLAQGVYRNPDGTVQAFGYRGVGETTVPDLARSPVDPGQMGTIYMTPHENFAGAFGSVHYMEANFDNPLVIDDWHNNLGQQIERGAKHFNQNLVDKQTGFTKEGNPIAFLGQRQPGVIWAARQLGHDGIIVRHGSESVEIVALHPHKVASSGAAEYTATSGAKSLTPQTPEQQTIQSRAALDQGGIRDLGQTNRNVTVQDPTDVSPEDNVRHLIEQSMSVQPVAEGALPGTGFDLRRLQQSEGLWKLNGRIFKAEVGDVPGYGGRPTKGLNVTDVTGQVGADPTLSPGMTKAMLVHDGISKGVAVSDLTKNLDADHQLIAQKLLDYEPNPAEYGRITLQDRNVRTLMSAMKSIEDGNMDHALLQLTQPREIEFPEEFGQKVKPSPKVDLQLDKPGETAPDGRILTETVDEHLRNAQQLKNFGELAEAAQRVKWAFEKDPVEAERLVRENPAKYQMPNTSHLETNKLLISPEEQSTLDMLRAKINENRQPMIEAEAAGNRPEAVRLAKESQAARAQMEQIFHGASDRAYGPELSGPMEKMPKREIPFQVGHISVPPILEERPPWAPLASGTTVPQIPSDWALLHRMHQDDVADIVNNTEIPGLPPPPFKTLKQGFGQKPGGKEPMGGAQAMALFRIASGGSSALLYGAAYHQDDPRTRRLMKTAAGILAVMAVLPQRDGWLAKQIKDAASHSMSVVMMHMLDLGAYMTATVGSHATEVLKTAIDLGNAWNHKNLARTSDIKAMFPTLREREVAMRALDDPNNPIHWNQFTPKQQAFLAGEGLFNLHMNDQLRAVRVDREMDKDILRHILPRKSFGALEAAEKNPGTTTFTRPPGPDAKIADYEAWTKDNKLPAPIVDLAFVQSRHMGEVGRTLMKQQVANEMARVGLLIPSTDNIPDGWSAVSRVPGLGKMMAPDAVTLALQRMENPNGGSELNNGFLRGVDVARSWLNRAIMAWPLVHSFNVLRRVTSLGWQGIKQFPDNVTTETLTGPSGVRAASYGVPLAGQRIDYATDHQNAIESTFNRLSEKSGKFGRFVLTPVGNFFGKFERGLWEHLVPGLALTAFNVHMQKWVNSTGGVFREGSPEFTAAGHRAADFSKTMMGKSAAVLRSPGLEFALRNILFAPQWLESSMKINVKAFGEVRGLATGNTKFSDLEYLPVKVKGALTAAAITYGLSMLLTKKPPKFNPQSEKYYARSGILDKNGRELGLDMNGFWGDDVKMLGDPTMYFMNRVSPLLQFGHTGLTGRDAFGRPIVDENLIDTGIGMLGPINTVTNAAARYINSPGGPTDMSKGDILRSAMEMSQLGTVSALPHTNDLMNQKLAHKILRINGLPADDPDLIYELQQIFAAAQVSRKNPFGKELINWIASQQRIQANQNPRVTATQHIWQRVKTIVRTMGSSSLPPSGVVIPSEMAPLPVNQRAAPTRQQYFHPSVSDTATHMMQ